MKRRTSIPGMSLALAVVLGVAATSAPAAAQPAAALGKPLASPDLAVGTVTVRIIAGAPSSPVVGTTVTLVVNNVPREARTDSAGRASFPGLPVGATVVAKVLDEDKAEKASEPFAVPDAGGMRVMISTKPMQAAAGGGSVDAPFAGGAGGQGMPNPRQLSGEPRPEQADPAGMITIRVTYDDFHDTPQGVTVALIGYAADDSTTFQTVITDAAGRAQFTDLDRSGGTAYYAMTLLPRNGAVDRLMSFPTVLESQHGVRMVLSGEKRSSTAEPVDDLAKGDRQVATPAGKVRVALEGVADATATIKLIDVATKKVIAEARPESAPPDPTQVKGGAQFVADPKSPAGSLDIQMVGGPGQTEDPMPNMDVRIVPADATDFSHAVTATTGADGTAHVDIKTQVPQKAVMAINGRPLASQPFDLAKSGGKLVIRAHWDNTGHQQALLDVAVTPGQVVYAECTSRGQHYRSLPVQLLEATGTKVSVYIFPRTMFRFGLQASVEDQLLAVQGKFEVTNWSWAPYRAGPDGLLVPLPHGFKGGVVFGADQAEVSVSAGEGFRIIRPIPPGGRPFHGGFSLAVEDGKIQWSTELPLGAFQSEIDIRQTQGMTVHPQAKMPIEVRPTPQGTYAILGPIDLLPRQPMAIMIDGMPSPPAWRTWVPRLIGLLVIGVIIAGVAFALIKKPDVALVSTDARRQALLEQLVTVERDGGNPKHREQLLRELEKLWG
jgi:hypothetical protein